MTIDPTLRAWAVRLVEAWCRRDPSIAEDVVQEASIRLIPLPDDAVDNPRGILARTCRLAWIDHWKHEGRSKRDFRATVSAEALMDGGWDHPAPFDPEEQAVTRWEIAHALRSLTENERYWLLRGVLTHGKQTQQAKTMTLRARTRLREMATEAA
jgi:DNA-directed RNA polymerase specialized sigma24 family protein